MTRIKLCGLSRPSDIEAANALMPDYIGFVFAPKSRRYVSLDTAIALKRLLDPGIRAVGVFVRERPEDVAGLLNRGVIEVAQLHGGEAPEYVARLRELTEKPIVQAFRVNDKSDLELAMASPADCVLLDNGAGGTGAAFDWRLIQGMNRPYFLAGGLDPATVADAIRRFHPYAVDVSSGIETDGRKDVEKMKAFVEAARAASGKEGTP